MARSVLSQLRRHLELLLAYFVQYAKVRLSYRADFLIGQIGRASCRERVYVLV